MPAVFQTLRQHLAVWRRWAGGAAVAAGGVLGVAPLAQAADVYWSIGVHQPGVNVRIANAPPVLVHTPPRVVYVSPPRVVHAPGTVIVVSQPGGRVHGGPPGHARHWHKDRRHGHRHGWDERHERRQEWRDERRDDWRGDPDGDRHERRHRH
jgi:hypothetical protein